MKFLTSTTFLLRFGLIVIFLMHSVTSIFSGSVNDFGTKYLDTIGFEPIGLYLAWLIKLSHIAFALSLIINRYLQPLAWITIGILLVGIGIVHWPDGWFVVGGGRNGIEYNILLILCILTVIYPNGLQNFDSKKDKESK